MDGMDDEDQGMYGEEGGMYGPEDGMPEEDEVLCLP